MRSEKELELVRDGGNSKYDSPGFTLALNKLINGDESHRDYIEKVLDARTRSAFVQSGFHPTIHDM